MAAYEVKQFGHNGKWSTCEEVRLVKCTVVHLPIKATEWLNMGGRDGADEVQVKSVCHGRLKEENKLGEQKERSRKKTPKCLQRQGNSEAHSLSQSSISRQPIKHPNTRHQTCNRWTEWGKGESTKGVQAMRAPFPQGRVWGAEYLRCSPRFPFRFPRQPRAPPRHRRSLPWAQGALCRTRRMPHNHTTCCRPSPSRTPLGHIL